MLESVLTRQSPTDSAASGKGGSTSTSELFTRLTDESPAVEHVVPVAFLDDDLLPKALAPATKSGSRSRPSRTVANLPPV